MSSGGEVRKVSRQDIQLVQNLIERCLQLYMNQKEVVNTLLIQAKIEPSFTELVWQKLEEENREFFKAYHVRLIVKNQIMMFNQLLEKQAQLMREVQPASNGASMSLSNGSNASSLRQMHLQYASAPRPAQAYCTVFQSSVINGGLSSNQGIQAANGSSNDGRIDMSTGMLPFHNQNMSVGVIQGANGISMKSEASFPNTSEFRFCTDGSFLEERSTMGDPSGSSFGCTELNGPPGNDPLLDTIDATAFGFLSHIPRNLSFSNLTDHDILETYGKSPFLDPETNEFSASLIAENEGDKKRLDSISEGYDGFSD